MSKADKLREIFNPDPVVEAIRAHTEVLKEILEVLKMSQRKNVSEKKCLREKMKQNLSTMQE